jgi:hypothetical protein
MALTAVAIAVTCSAQFGMGRPPINNAALHLGRRPIRTLLAVVLVCPFQSQMGATITNAAAPRTQSPCAFVRRSAWLRHGPVRAAMMARGLVWRQGAGGVAGG